MSSTDFITWYGDGVQLGPSAFHVIRWFFYVVALKIVVTGIVRVVRR